MKLKIQCSVDEIFVIDGCWLRKLSKSPESAITAHVPLQWRHDERNGVSNHQPRDCLLNRLFRRRTRNIFKLRVTGLCDGNSPVAGEFPAQRASDAENVSIWWRHHENLRMARVPRTSYKLTWDRRVCYRVPVHFRRSTGIMIEVQHERFKASYLHGALKDSTLITLRPRQNGAI